MGRGNVATNGKFEGLFYVDYDNFYVYYESNMYECDEETSQENINKAIKTFVDDMQRKYASFTPMKQRTWLSGNGQRKEVILENGLFYIAVEDNEWSLAFELLQKEPDYDNLIGMQKANYKKYLQAMQDCLLKQFQQIGVYAGPWTHGVINREE